MTSTRAIQGFLSAAIIASASTLYAQTPLLERVKEHDSRLGPLTITVAGTGPAMSFDQLIPDSDLIVEGVVNQVRPTVNAEQTAIMSDYSVMVERVLFASAKVPVSTVPQSITVRNFGGATSILGKQVIETDAVMPPFAVGDELVLVLKASANGQGFEIVGANFGCFHVTDAGLVAIGAAAEVAHSAFIGQSVDTLIGYIQQIAATPATR